jgi:hypothetical protein
VSVREGIQEGGLVLVPFFVIMDEYGDVIGVIGVSVGC